MKFDKLKSMALKTNIRKKINSDISKLTTNKYFDAIPLKDISDILKKNGVILLQEDNTEWSGFITGAKGEDTWELGDINSKNGEFYTPLKNAILRMTWYKMTSGRYEIVAYVS